MRIVICGFLREKINDRDKDKPCSGGIPIARPSGGSKGSAASYAGAIQYAFRGFDASRFLKSTPEELLFGNENADIATIIRNDNSSVVQNAHSINSVTKGRILNGILESNREGPDINKWVALPRITGGLNIPDEMAKTATRAKFIMLLSKNISHATSEENKDVIRKSPQNDSDI